MTSDFQSLVTQAVIISNREVWSHYSLDQYQQNFQSQEQRFN